MDLSLRETQLKTKIQDLEKTISELNNDKKILDSLLQQKELEYSTEIENMKIELEKKMLLDLEQIENDTKKKIASYEERLVTQKNSLISEYEIKLTQMRLNYESNMEIEINKLKSSYEKMQGELIDTQRIEIEKIHEEIEKKINSFSNQFKQEETSIESNEDPQQIKLSHNSSGMIDIKNELKKLELNHTQEKLSMEVEITALKDKLKLTEEQYRFKMNEINQKYHDLESLYEFLQNEKENINQKLEKSVYFSLDY